MIKSVNVCLIRISVEPTQSVLSCWKIIEEGGNFVCIDLSFVVYIVMLENIHKFVTQHLLCCIFIDMYIFLKDFFGCFSGSCEIKEVCWIIHHCIFLDHLSCKGITCAGVLLRYWCSFGALWLSHSFGTRCGTILVSFLVWRYIIPGVGRMGSSYFWGHCVLNKLWISFDFLRQCGNKSISVL